ncbi:cathepsin B [Elysia marginata]|uniref:Cathepsin B-like cysteine proteinase n=1 Tax=Elysia marginata TaxID=1093978 RepID=A0AAV4GN36_9GAST|nr:cathepsin B [Elysia marginata]
MRSSVRYPACPVMNLIKVLFIAGLLAVTFAASFEPAPLSDAEIDLINSGNGVLWKAGRNFGPNDMPYVKRLLGVDMDANDLYNRLHMSVLEPVSIEGELPQNFDGRERWPHCDSFKEIRDQSACGSCWAFGSAEAMSDRICAATGKNIRISSEDINSCCDGFGCAGGYPSAAWAYYVNEGVVTGGKYHSGQGCRPYSLPFCEHHTAGPLKNCSNLDYNTPKCQKSCIQGYSKTYEQDKHKGKRSYMISGAENIMKSIYAKGSVTASFTVYSDFLQYKSGVYHHVTGDIAGGHAVKIIGWGVEAGQNYWLVANSWNTDWGDKGFFKIIKGIDECGIESAVTAGDPAE